MAAHRRIRHRPASEFESGVFMRILRVMVGNLLVYRQEIVIYSGILYARVMDSMLV
jgi:hypothetical protein